MAKMKSNGGGRRVVPADTKITADVMKRFDVVVSKIREMREVVAQGGVTIDTEARLRAYQAREEELRRREVMAANVKPLGGLAGAPERIIGENEILLIGFLAAGMVAARAVGRIRLEPPLHGGGTGFLVSPDMLITNHHVIADETFAEIACIDFEEHDALGDLGGTSICALDPGRFFWSDPALDITVVALADTDEVRAKTAGLGWHPMVGVQGKIRIGDAVNIIQYPGGRAQRGERVKSLVMHNSNLMYLENDRPELASFCWYSSDTEPGSSGSPVFNNRWEVIGVHHKSIPDKDEAGRILDADRNPLTQKAFDDDPERALYLANEGIRTSRIVDELAKWTPPSRRMAGLRDDLLTLWKGSTHENIGQRAARTAIRAALGRGSGLEAAAPQPRAHAPALNPIQGNGASGGAPIVIHLHLPGA